MDIKMIRSMWEEDCVIPKAHLDETSRNTPALHAKYLSMLSNASLKLKDAEFKQKALMLDKWKWYNGKMSQEEVERLGWEPDPFNGLKILKGEMEHYVEADPELIESEARITYLKECIDTLSEIINNLNWRHQTIKNMIDYKKFEAGF